MEFWWLVYRILISCASYYEVRNNEFRVKGFERDLGFEGEGSRFEDRA